MRNFIALVAVGCALIAGTANAGVLLHATIVAAVPEPATLALLGPGIAGIGFARQGRLN